MARTIIRMKLRQEKVVADYPDIIGNSTGLSKVGAINGVLPLGVAGR